MAAHKNTEISSVLEDWLNSSFYGVEMKIAQTYSDPFHPAPLSCARRISGVHIANPDGARELIMVVDDEEFASLMVERVLTAEGYRVVVARDGYQAIEFYKRLAGQIDLVILDFAMPFMDGFAVFNQLQRIDPEAAVALTSGTTSPARLKAMLASGLRGFIPKPHTARKLLSQVREMLDSAPARAEIRQFSAA